MEKGSWRIGRVPDCSHAGVPGSSPANPAWVFRRLSMLVGDRVNGGLVGLTGLRLRPVCRRFCRVLLKHALLHTHASLSHSPLCKDKSNCHLLNYIDLY